MRIHSFSLFAIIISGSALLEGFSRAQIPMTPTGRGHLVISPDLTPVGQPVVPDLEILATGSKAAFDRQQGFAREQNLPIEVSNSLGMRFRLIPPGTMPGSPEDEHATPDLPLDRPNMPEPLWVAIHEVTQRIWIDIMGSNPSHFQGETNLPVEQVSWDDCQEFIGRLNDQLGGGYRLLYEWEWEYCCRAGTTTPFCYGTEAFSNQMNFNPEYPYFDAEDKHKAFRNRTIPVGSLYPNGFGLFDMHGNVWEWCQNSARATALDTPEEDAPAPSSDFRVNRGGGWHNPSDHCASSSRGIISPKSRFCYLGLRLARSLDLSQLRTPPDTGTASKINP